MGVLGGTNPVVWGPSLVDKGLEVQTPVPTLTPLRGAILVPSSFVVRGAGPGTWKES